MYIIYPPATFKICLVFVFALRKEKWKKCFESEISNTHSKPVRGL